MSAKEINNLTHRLSALDAKVAPLMELDKVVHEHRELLREIRNQIDMLSEALTTKQKKTVIFGN
jgi:hypothetical protein